MTATGEPVVATATGESVVGEPHVRDEISRVIGLTQIVLMTLGMVINIVIIIWFAGLFVCSYVCLL